MLNKQSSVMIPIYLDPQVLDAMIDGWKIRYHKMVLRQRFLFWKEISIDKIVFRPQFNTLHELMPKIKFHQETFFYNVEEYYVE